MNALLGLLRYLPAAINIGLEVKGLIEATTAKVAPTTGVEVFASQVLKSLPAMISAGVDVMDVVTQTNGQVRQMIAESRPPTDAEWAAQATRIKILEGQLEAAAAPR